MCWTELRKPKFSSASMPSPGMCLQTIQDSVMMDKSVKMDTTGRERTARNLQRLYCCWSEEIIKEIFWGGQLGKTKLEKAGKDK